MAAADVAAKLKDILRLRASHARLDQSKASTTIGYFWDPSVLQNEESMEAAVCVHLDFILAVVRAGIMLDITRTMCTEAVQALNSQHAGKLYCETFGSFDEWLRNEGSCLKKLFGLIRLKEGRAIDCSRQGATMKLCCQEYRAAKQKHAGKRGRSVEPGSSSSKEMPGLAKPIWDMTPAEISQAMSGRGVASAKPAVEDLSTPQTIRSKRDMLTYHLCLFAIRPF